MSVKVRQVMVVCAITCACFAILVETRTRTIRRGFRLVGHERADAEFHVWSQGVWRVTDNDRVETTEMTHPYTLVLAVCPRDDSVDAITINQITMHSEDGKKSDVLSLARQGRVQVGRGWTPVGTKRRGVFSFGNAVVSGGQVTLDVEVTLERKGEMITITDTLELELWEEESWSFSWFQAIMSV